MIGTAGGMLFSITPAEDGSEADSICDFGGSSVGCREVENP